MQNPTEPCSAVKPMGSSSRRMYVGNLAKDTVEGFYETLLTRLPRNEVAHMLPPYVDLLPLYRDDLYEGHPTNRGATEGVELSFLCPLDLPIEFDFPSPGPLTAHLEAYTAQITTRFSSPETTAFLVLIDTELFFTWHAPVPFSMIDGKLVGLQFRGPIATTPALSRDPWKVQPRDEYQKMYIPINVDKGGILTWILQPLTAPSDYGLQSLPPALSLPPTSTIRVGPLSRATDTEEVLRGNGIPPLLPSGWNASALPSTPLPSHIGDFPFYEYLWASTGPDTDRNHGIYEPRDATVHALPLQQHPQTPTRALILQRLAKIPGAPVRYYAGGREVNLAELVRRMYHTWIPGSITTDPQLDPAGLIRGRLGLGAKLALGGSRNIAEHELLQMLAAQLGKMVYLGGTQRRRGQFDILVVLSLSYTGPVVNGQGQRVLGVSPYHEPIAYVPREFPITMLLKRKDGSHPKEELHEWQTMEW